MKRVIICSMFFAFILNTAIPENLKQIKIGYQGKIYESTLFIAKEKGFFKNAGFEATLVKFDPDKIQNSLEKKDADMVLLSPLSVKNYENIKFAGAVSLARIMFITKSKSEIKSLINLKNKKIGLDEKNETGSAILAFALKKAEIDSTNNVKIIPVQSSDLKKSLDNGKVNVILYSNEDYSVYFDKKKYKKVLNLTCDDEFRFSVPYFITIRNDFENKKSEIIIPVLKILNQTNEFITNNIDETFKVLSSTNYLTEKQQDKDSLNDYGWFPATYKEIDRIRNYYEARRKTGLSVPYDYDNYIKLHFLEIKKDVLSINENIEYNIIEDCCKVD
jgi:ABC-type nitrate/sulfonate/bicarbonate transport system substrate-binding protein